MQAGVDINDLIKVFGVHIVSKTVGLEDVSGVLAFSSIILVIALKLSQSDPRFMMTIIRVKLF